jgi:hypothetical protein
VYDLEIFLIDDHDTSDVDSLFGTEYCVDMDLDLNTVYEKVNLVLDDNIYEDWSVKHFAYETLKSSIFQSLSFFIN